ncbi:DUF3426 domain-containing protein [Polynucleobacter necessarius]|uniref:DUF3426 domain-containing protein n=1 Tax=Polynucleobacter necessarius TaxID=576610 RepID=UPI001E2CCF04|nr:DUF3426 domain-containing protein [Polynucleobacter necessarius]
MHGTLKPALQSDGESIFAAPAQKKSLKLAAYIWLSLLLLVFGEHLSRNSLLPALAPRVDGTSNAIVVRAFQVLQHIDAKLCRALGCLDRSVSDFSAWKIISATLSPENARESLKSSANQSTLQVQIQNRLAITVLPPNLEITLTDAEESEVQSLRFTPQEWLPQVWQEAHPDFLKKGVPSGEILQIELPITLPPNAAGYRVQVLYLYNHYQNPIYPTIFRKKVIYG